MFPISARLAVILILFYESSSSPAKTSASVPPTELREEEYRQVCEFLSKKSSEIDDILKEGDIRHHYDLPKNPKAELTESQQILLVELKSSLLLQECKSQFPHISEGGLIAAILAVNAFDDLSDNPYTPIYSRPNVPNSKLENAAQLIRKHFDDWVLEIKNMQYFQQSPVHSKKDIGENLLASLIVNKLAEELSIEYATAMDIHLYLQARSHWAPQDYRIRSPRKNAITTVQSFQCDGEMRSQCMNPIAASSVADVCHFGEINYHDAPDTDSGDGDLDLARNPNHDLSESPCPSVPQSLMDTLPLEGSRISQMRAGALLDSFVMIPSHADLDRVQQDEVSVDVQSQPKNDSVNAHDQDQQNHEADGDKNDEVDGEREENSLSSREGNAESQEPVPSQLDCMPLRFGVFNYAGGLTYRNLALLHALSPRFTLPNHHIPSVGMPGELGLSSIDEVDDDSGAEPLITPSSNQANPVIEIKDLDLSVPYINGEELFLEKDASSMTVRYKSALSIACGVALGTLFLSGVGSTSS